MSRFARFGGLTARRPAPREHSTRPTAGWPPNGTHGGSPLAALENALVLAAARRLLHPDHLPPLAPIRSLAYCLPVIEEVLELEVGPDYCRYVRRKIEHCSSRPPTP